MAKRGLWLDPRQPPVKVPKFLASTPGPVQSDRHLELRRDLEPSPVRPAFLRTCHPLRLLVRKRAKSDREDVQGTVRRWRP